MKKNKLLLTILGVIFTIVLVAGGSFALWSWTSDRGNDTNVTFTTEKGFSCSVDGGGNITEANIKLVPTSCDNSEYAIKRTITTNVVNNRDIAVSLDLWLDIKKLSQGLSDSNNFRYALTASSESCNKDIISEGTFNTLNTTTNSRVNILEGDIYSLSGTNTYYLYIWLDYNGMDRLSQNEEFDLELGGECTGYNPEREYSPNKPHIYDTGLIPVKLSDDGTIVTSVSENDSTWYDYENKKWANAVLVKSSGVRNRDENRVVGTQIDLNDILAYYVWIPRYSYKVWRLTGSSPNSENKPIEIKFIPMTMIDSLESVTAIGDYYTPPGFWWDTDNDRVRDDGEELSGIWVGKFDVSHETLSSSTSNDSLGSCVDAACYNYKGLRILPNVTILRYNTISRFFFASRHMEDDGNPFGLISKNIDSHLIKNSEWGAVTYLTRSVYGKNDSPTANSKTITGCGNTGNCDTDGYYHLTSYPQSTTGNVTGVFDMSGSIYDYVMGNWNNANTYGGVSPSTLEAKYYDLYPNPPFSGTQSNNAGLCTLAYCGGHALNEVAGWSGGAYFVYNSVNVWFRRGGNSIYYFIHSNGQYNSNNGSRPVLVSEYD